MTTKPGHRGEHEVSRKPSRGEGRSVSAEPVCSCAFSLMQFCARDRGCSAHPAFPAPSFFGGTEFMQNSGAIAPRDCEAHFQSSSPALCAITREAVIQYSRGRVIEPKGRSVLDTRFRGYDGFVLGKTAKQKRRGMNPAAFENPSLEIDLTSTPDQVRSAIGQAAARRRRAASRPSPQGYGCCGACRASGWRSIPAPLCRC